MNQISYRSLIRTSICLIVIPILISFLLYLFFKFSIFISLVIIYSVILIFLLPSDSFFSDSVDYETKVSHPTFRLDKKLLNINNEKIEDFILFFIILFCLISTLILFYILSVNH